MSFATDTYCRAAAVVSGMAILAAGMFLLAPGPHAAKGTGTTYYLSSSGSDSNSGVSQRSPWKTIAKVRSFEPDLKPGDEVLFERGGVWHEQLEISGVDGTASDPITFGNYGTGNLPVIDGGSRLPFGIVDAAGNHQGVNDAPSSYVVVDGFEIRNTTRGGIIFTHYNQPGIVIQNNYIHDLGYGAYPGGCSGCYQVDDSNYGYDEAIGYFNWNPGSAGIKILNNTVKIIGGHNSIMVDGDLGGPVIQGNSIGPGCSHNCIDFKASVNVTIAQNTINCKGAVKVNGQSYNSCNGNSIFALQHPSFTMTATIKQNAVYGAAHGYAIFGLQTQGGRGPISANFYNNTVYVGSTGAVPFYIDSCAGGTLDIQNNIFFGGSWNKMGASCMITADYNDKYHTPSGVPSGSHDKSVDPLFVNPDAMDFHLQASSPVLNAGNPNIIPGAKWMGALGTSGNASGGGTADTQAGRSAEAAVAGLQCWLVSETRPSRMATETMPLEQRPSFAGR